MPPKKADVMCPVCQEMFDPDSYGHDVDCIESTNYGRCIDCIGYCPICEEEAELIEEEK